jgi:hypothetical protein
MKITDPEDLFPKCKGNEFICQFLDSMYGDKIDPLEVQYCYTKAYLRASYTSSLTEPLVEEGPETTRFKAIRKLVKLTLDHYSSENKYSISSVPIEDTLHLLILAEI